MVDFGFIPEFVNRLTKIVQFRKLTVKDLEIIAVSPTGVIASYNRQLAPGLSIKVSNQAISMMAGFCVETGMMARGLRMIIGSLVEDLVFSGATGEIPFLSKDVKRVILGLKLDVYAIMRRLRHTSHELTTRIYITENQELSLMKHEAKMEELRAERRQATSCLPIQKAKISSIARPSIQFASYISEQDAIQRLNPLEITVLGLQKYGEQSGIIKTTKGKRTYDQQSIEDLANNYFTKKEAMNFLKLKKSGFFYWLQNHGIQAVIIGKISLFRREEIINKGRERKSA